MLTSLSISNYAIIDQLQIGFDKGLNVITGETGAGKSIIAGALGLILGARADSSVLVRKDRKCIVEGIFEVRDRKDVWDFLMKNDLDASEEIFIRREIAPNGKSRAFINDTPVTLDVLGKLSSWLVDLHRQFDSHELGGKDFQLEVLDALGGNDYLLSNYREKFLRWQELRKEMDSLVDQKQKSEKEFDFNSYQFRELDDLKFSPGEIERLEQEQKLLTSAGDITAKLTELYVGLVEEDQSIISRLKNMISSLDRYADSNKNLQSIVDRLKSTLIELTDLGREASGLSTDFEFDPKKEQQVSDRISEGYRLMKKHGVKTTDELIAIKEEIGLKLQSAELVDDRLKKIEAEIESLLKEVNELAETISASRKKQVKGFEKAVNQLLSDVGMPSARIKVEIAKKDPGTQGIDEVQFLFSANQGGGKLREDGFMPVGKVASGGELNRLMLSIKSLVAESVNRSVLVFDEIDTGISGEAARQVGNILRELSRKMQIICITHQPQIAGKGNAHFLVYKDMIKGTFATNVIMLSEEERIVTIAKMLGGEKPTNAALANAREMISN